MKRIPTRLRTYGDHIGANVLLRLQGGKLLELYKTCDTGRLVMTPLERRFPDGSWVRALRVASEYRVEAFVPPSRAQVRRMRRVVTDTKALCPVLIAPRPQFFHQRWQISGMNIGGFSTVPLFDTLYREPLSGAEAEALRWRWYLSPPGGPDDVYVQGWEEHREVAGDSDSRDYYVAISTEITYDEQETNYDFRSGPYGSSKMTEYSQSVTHILGIRHGVTGSLVAVIDTTSNSGAAVTYTTLSPPYPTYSGWVAMSGSIFYNPTQEHFAVNRDDPSIYGGFYSKVSFDYSQPDREVPEFILTESSETKAIFKGQTRTLFSGSGMSGTIAGGVSRLYQPGGRDVMVFGAVSVITPDRGTNYLTPQGWVSIINYGDANRPTYNPHGWFGVATDEGFETTDFAFENGLATVGCKDEDGDLITFPNFDVTLANTLARTSHEELLPQGV